jgi:hypothetical protein
MAPQLPGGPAPSTSSVPSMACSASGTPPIAAKTWTRSASGRWAAWMAFAPSPATWTSSAVYVGFGGSGYAYLDFSGSAPAPAPALRGTRSGHAAAKPGRYHPDALDDVGGTATLARCGHQRCHADPVGDLVGGAGFGSEAVGLPRRAADRPVSPTSTSWTFTDPGAAMASTTMSLRWSMLLASRAPPQRLLADDRHGCPDPGGERDRGSGCFQRLDTLSPLKTMSVASSTTQVPWSMEPWPERLLRTKSWSCSATASASAPPRSRTATGRSTTASPRALTSIARRWSGRRRQLGPDVERACGDPGRQRHRRHDPQRRAGRHQRADLISGVGTAKLGKGTIDTLTGGAGDDVFVLGDSRGRFYDDGSARSSGPTTSPASPTSAPATSCS